ncbi:hypothetical protein [Geminocystis sp. GBBB08]|uniref:hypothetical protein n=1 Tax=Geminocystis sp. GBBB08 TaxID=2604140 RepID=UPI0027E24293|nr:hypothetical protein [Geminocystis sp. GBBB08]MBL1210631.1 hypothetical protein [Geminocystis sp. GBBB08]
MIIGNPTDRELDCFPYDYYTPKNLPKFLTFLDSYSVPRRKIGNPFVIDYLPLSDRFENVKTIPIVYSGYEILPESGEEEENKKVCIHRKELLDTLGEIYVDGLTQYSLRYLSPTEFHFNFYGIKPEDFENNDYFYDTMTRAVNQKDDGMGWLTVSGGFSAFELEKAQIPFDQWDDKFDEFFDAFKEFVYIY